METSKNEAKSVWFFLDVSMQHARLRGEDEHAARKHPEKRKPPRRFLDVSMPHAHLDGDIDIFVLSFALNMSMLHGNIHKCKKDTVCFLEVATQHAHLHISFHLYV